MRNLPFPQVYDVALLRLRDSVDYHLRTLEGSKAMPQAYQRELAEGTHWIAGAVHQWYTTILFLCEAATEPGTERTATTARLEVDRRQLELEVAATVESLERKLKR